MSRLDPLYRPALLPGEIIVLILTGLIAVSVVLSSTIGGQAVDWLAFAPPVIAAMLVVVSGCFVRQWRGMERLALLLISAALLLTFGAFVAVFTFMFFPISNTLIDPRLMQMDAALGYSWPDAVRWMAQYPLPSKGLALLYQTSVWQLLAVMTLLAMLRREADLHRMTLTAALALLGMMGIWVFAPSLGPTPFVGVTPDIVQAASIVYGQSYGAQLQVLATSGVETITPATIVWAIAFPSVHMLILCLVVWFSRKTSLFLPIALINIPMLPAIAIQGGHHFVDLVGGLAIFGVAMVVSNWVVNPARNSPAFRHRPI